MKLDSSRKALAEELGVPLGEVPSPGERARHYKGGLYRVLAVGRDESTLAPVVVYESLDNHGVWVRSLKDWLTPVSGAPRFRILRAE